MRDRFFVDTNILVYAHDASGGSKHERARTLVEQLWRDRSGVVSTQVLQELAVTLRKRSGAAIGPRVTRDLVRDYMAWDVVVNDVASILDALEIEERYQLSFWDALIVQAAQSCGASVLYSEDLSDGQKYGTTQVVNPLLKPR